MSWKVKKTSKKITCNYGNKIQVIMSISADETLDTFVLVVFKGIESFKEHHPGTISEGIGYSGLTEGLIGLGVLDNSMNPKNKDREDYDSIITSVSNVKHSVLERKRVILKILAVLVDTYDFPQQHYTSLKKIVEKSFTFLSAVTFAKSRIENAKIFRSVDFYPNEEKQAVLLAKKRGPEAINLRSALNKLLSFASGRKFENFTEAEITILSTQERFIPLLGLASSWLLALKKEFPHEMAAALKNEPLPNNSNSSYAEIQSSIDINNPEKQEEEEPRNKLRNINSIPTEKTSLLSGNLGSAPKRKKAEVAQPEETNSSDSCFSCNIS